ncbi:cAMP-dependent protein kinase inhibitor alpha-like isoform X2 [Planococcus citri]
MSEQDTNANGDIAKDFLSTGRTGRRNALADVLGEHQNVSTSDLPSKLEKLSTNDAESSTSKQNCVNENQNSTTSTSTKEG